MSSFEYEGIDEMITRIQLLGAKAVRLENGALRAGAEELKQTMERNAPGPSAKKRVHLKENIQVGNPKQKAYGKVIEVGPGNSAFYAIFLEFGTSKMSPKPFVEPSVVESGDKVIHTMANELRNGLT